MARPLRIEYPGAYYHIINRGLERRQIFRSPKDYEYFLGLLEYIHEKYGVVVYSYCLMPNHYHIYLQTPQGNLAKAMRQLDGNFTQKFNKRHKRVGPLFQGRYKAVLVQADIYSLQLSKYIHLNPVKAKMTEKPENFEYSSYSAYLGKVKTPTFLNTEWLLSQFHKTKKKAIKVLRQYTHAIEEDGWIPEQETYKGAVLAENDFIKDIQERYLEQQDNSEIPILRLIQKDSRVLRVEKVVNSLNLPLNLQKKILIYALKEFSPLTLNEIGEKLLGLHYSSVSKVVSRLKEQSKTDRQLEGYLTKINLLLTNV